MAQSELYFNRIKSVDEIIRSIDNITPEDVLETANELLREDTLTKITIKSKNNLIVSRKRAAA
jgi:predicted Zn-dependent peptidase